MKNILVLILSVVFSAQFVYSQSITPLHHFSFNSCNGNNSTGVIPGFLFGIADCQCGVEGDALSLSEDGQFAEFPNEINSFLNSDFTFSFYMLPKSTVTGTEGIDIWSISENCSIDTMFRVKYFPVNGEIRVRVADQLNNDVAIKGVLSEKHCWSYVAITKEGQEFKLFIDSEEQVNLASDRFSSNLITNFQSLGSLRLSEGSCINNNRVAEYEGLIDELRIYDRALTETEIKSEDFAPNQIIEDRIIIRKGESTVIETGGSCSNDFSWSPIDGIVNVNSLMPVITPEVSADYILEINLDGCITSDVVNVVVIDTANLDCSNILLPSAFTPNGDNLNDEYGISNDFVIDNLQSFEVFDKWGGRLFFSASDRPKWDGRFRNSYVAPGPYVYRVKYNCEGEDLVLNGVVNVIR